MSATRIGPVRRYNDVAKSLFNELVGRSVREFRLAAGMTINRLSDSAGISASLLQNIETGAVPCPLFVARNIAEAVDCTIDDLAPVTLEDPEDDA